MKNQHKKTSSDELNKIKNLIDEQRKLIRGKGGRFISLKKLEQTKELPLTQPIKTTFFAQEVKKYYVGDKVYFAIDDVLKTATPILGKDTIEYTEDYEQTRALVAKKIGNIEVADADGILSLIKEVVAVFPGPLSRWLKESNPS